MVEDKAFITARVSPDGEATLWQVIGAMSATHPDMPTIRIIADTGLDKGRLVLETAAGSITFRASG